MMKLTHILASAAIISTLSACNGSLQTADRTPVDYVNPYIGNISHLLVPTFPTIQLPNSMLRVYPERADYTSELLKGLPLIVTNHRERSAFNLSPYQGKELRPIITYNYDNEHLTPYSYEVDLNDNSMKAEYALSHQSALYRITFEARAESDRSMVVCVSAPENGWARYLPDTTIDLKEDWTTYTYEFTMADKDDNKGRLDFELGKQGTTAGVDIRNVRIEAAG